jgi:hypothetical protein
MGVTDKMTGAELILTRAMSGGKLTAQRSGVTNKTIKHKKITKFNFVTRG